MPSSAGDEPLPRGVPARETLLDDELPRDDMSMPQDYAWLESTDEDRRRVYLLPNATVGRADNNAVLIADPRVSATHACLRYAAPDQWVLRDLGSKNGTKIDGVSIAPGKDLVLENDATIAFGGVPTRWIFHSGLPADLIVREVTVGSPASGELVPTDGIVALPSVEEPRSLVFRRADRWVLEGVGAESQALHDFVVFEVERHAYQVRISDYTPTLTSSDVRPTIATARLVLRVSRDEEHVSAEVGVAGATQSLSPRSHLYLLVVLARARAADRARGLGDDEAGWCHVEDVQKEMAVSSPEALNVHVFRVRKEFGRLSFSDPGQVIERRRMSGQIRLGLSDEQVDIELST